ncbi:TonB family C-terminal domain-containing protein [Daejeonella rubra]|uniref:TonB family C-terminal domain-containing protein n=1 Tax=Daejeonella rubra TaxID=990371 RepID=A0A1G9YKN5_9SPHI|nr:M56 family metallopeptidase [Daejeonella rubra]SDN09043.1 TonB family C-terminal domain-containing protein [Daejeonella rubra]
MNSLNYLLQTNLYLILFMGFYTLVLRNETFFRQNRIFLNASIILSFTIPFINSPWFNELFITQKIRESGIIPVNFNYDTVVVGVIEESNAWSMADLLLWTYIGGATLFLVRFMFRIFMLRSNLKVEKGSAFSFFNKLVVDKDLPNSETIIDHEKVHIRELHSADILLIELSTIINWFNPVIYLYKKEIRHIHEFIADEEASNLMQSKSSYAMLLFSNTMGINPSQLSNNFFNNSLLKRRITMLYKTKSRRTGLWKYGFSAPLFAIMLIYSAASANSDNNVLQPAAEKVLLVIAESKPAQKIKESTILIEKQGSIAETSGLEIKSTKINSENSTNELISESIELPSINSEHGIIDTIIVQPEFPGGINGWSQYLSSTIKYPAEAKKNNVQGRVIVSFIIQKDGSLADIKVLRGVGSGLDEEAVRVISESPKWKPGTKDREPVNVAFTIPIQFKLPAPQSVVPGKN